MSHVTDGQLHAYLDGALDRMGLGAGAAELRAHLETCPECQARLADEREIRERSKEILAGSGPSALNMPPFEEIRRRAMAPAPAPQKKRSGPPRGWGLAWAASVVLALGLGWVGRDLGWRGADLASSEPGLEVFSETPAAAQNDPAAIDAVGGLDNAGEFLDTRNAGEDAELRADLETSDLRAQPAVPQSAFEAPVLDAAPGRSSSAVNEVLGSVSRNRDPNEQVEPKVTSEGQPIPEPVGQAPAQAPTPSSDELAQRRGAAQQVAAEPQEGAAAAGNRATEADGRRLAELTVETDAIVEREEEAPGESVLAVPGLEVLSVSVEGEGVLVRQQLPEGGVLELRYTPTDPLGDEAERNAALGFSRDRTARQNDDLDEARRELQKQDSTARVVRPHADGWLVATAPLSAEDLERLLDRIR